jgi:tetratricopeptide (TPR) repeat protein
MGNGVLTRRLADMANSILLIGVGAGLILAGAGCSGSRTAARDRQVAAPMLGSAGAATTSRDDLTRTVLQMEARLASKPDDAVAAVTLADALIRQTRVSGNPALAWRAERALARVLTAQPDHFYARRMLAAVLLSQHRFREAVQAAERALQIRRDDAWLHGVLGDAHLELGEYEQAFAAFDTMAERRPDAAAYARASYARELQGDLAGAITVMKMALEATSARDPESLAWHHAQLGHLYLSANQLAEAHREYRHADFVFPDHPLAAEGLARAMADDGAYAAALVRVKQLLARTPSPALLAFAGDLLSALGRTGEAETQYRLAEAAWQTDAPEPARLALFLADRGRRIDDAVRLAERAAADRADIFTADALAWAYFKAGRLADARTAIARALRTGTRDRGIRRHADAIAGAHREVGVSR